MRLASAGLDVADEGPEQRLEVAVLGGLVRGTSCSMIRQSGQTPMRGRLESGLFIFMISSSGVKFHIGFYHLI